MEVEQDRLRTVGRALGEFILQWAEAAARPFDGDVVLALVYHAIVQANVPSATDEPARPISIMAVANSLSLSRETTRRHVLRLEAMGLAHRTAEGVIVPATIADGPAALERRRELHERTRAFVLALRGGGVSFAQLDPSAADARDLTEPDRQRLVERTVDRFILRWAEIGARDFGGDLWLLLVYTAILQANVRHILQDERLNAFYGEQEAPPDVLRRPISVTALAASIGLSRETTRRYGLRLEAMGLVTRVPDGLMTTQQDMWAEAYMKRLRELYANVRQFVLMLRAAGAAFED